MEQKARVRVRVRDYAFLPGRPFLWAGDWARAPCTFVGGEDVSADIPVKITAFSDSLHWLSEDTDLGVRGVSHLELLILFEL